MKVIKPYAEIIDALNYDDILKKLEMCGRVCYKSEEKITDGSAEKFVRGIVKSGHEAVIEHFSFSVRFVVDRAVANEIVRHRMASYCQESTRYCNYSNDDFGSEITFITPCFLDYKSEGWNTWQTAMRDAEYAYFKMLDIECRPQEARSVLPNSTKTELVMTCNLREWRHFFKLRCAKSAHPQMREVTIPLLQELKQMLPVLFEDI